MISIRRAAAAIALIAATPVTAAPPPVPPKLIVAIAVDQFALSLYDRYRAGFTGGLARLGRGIAFTGYQSHAATETCPGHSTILTGRHPAGTGIVANTWFDRATGSNVYCVSVRGTADPDARGPQNLRVDTLGDWLKRAEPAARVVSVSGKDRAAIMLGGHHADAVFWWKDGTGFATSRYAGPATSEIMRPVEAFDRTLTAEWRTTPPALWPTDLSPTCAILERPERFGALAMTGRVPPEAARASEQAPGFVGSADFADQLRASPLFDAVTVRFADDLIGRYRLGRGPGTDLLAISLTATDYIGHRYGSGGPEMCVQVAALDHTIGVLLDHLDAIGAPYVVALTADHGSTDAAERAKETGLDARRVDGAALVHTLNEHLGKTLGLSYEPIVGDDPQQLTINVGADAALRRRVRDAAVAWLKARPEVAAVSTADEVAAAVPPAGRAAPDLTLAERFHESYDPQRSGDIQVAFKPYTSFGTPRSPGDVVAGHGSPWDHDRRVPILFWWPGAAADRRPDPIETVDIAPTLAAIARIPAPPVDGRCLPSVAPDCPAR